MSLTFWAINKLFSNEFQNNVFIRCIKPNKELSQDIFDENFVTLQLKCSGTFEYQQLMQEGFPVQTDISEIIIAYGFSSQTFPLKNNNNLNLLLEVIGLNRNDFKIGKTKIFFRPLTNLDTVLRPSAESVYLVVKIYKTKIEVECCKQMADYCKEGAEK